MIHPTPADVARARDDNAIRYPGTPDASADTYHATGAAVERAQIERYLVERGLMAEAYAIAQGEHWEGERDG